MRSVNITSTDQVPYWVHMVDTPPTDDEPWSLALEELERERGLWLGAVLLALAFIAGVAVGTLVLR